MGTRSRRISGFLIVATLFATHHARVKADNPQPGINEPQGHTGQVFAISSSPDGQTIASAGEDAVIRLRDPRSGEILRTLSGHKGAVRALAFSPFGKILASGGLDQDIRLWDVESGKVLATLSGHTGEIFDIAFADDGKTLASASGDTSIRLWDMATKTEVRGLDGHSVPVRGVAFSHDGQTIASAGGSDQTVRIWNVADGKLRSTIATSPPFPTQAVSFTPDGLSVAVCGGSMVQVFNVETGQLSGRLGLGSVLDTLEFSPDGQTLAVAGRNDGFPTIPGDPAATSSSGAGQIQLLAFPQLVQRGAITGHSATIWSLAFSPDGKTIASAGGDRSVRLWNSAQTTPVWRWTGPYAKDLPASQRPMMHEGTVIAAAFSPDGQIVATSAALSPVTLWDVATHEPRWILDPPKSPTGEQQVRALAYSPNGKTLAMGGADRAVTLWDTATNEPRATLSGHEGAVTSLAFSADGKTLASGSQDSSAIVWDLATGKPRFTFARHTSAVDHVALSPDGRTLATGSHDWTVKLWNTATGKLLATLEEHRAPISDLAFTRDGRAVVSSSLDGTAKLWDVATGAKLREFVASPPIQAMALIDGGTSVIASTDGMLKRWSTADGQKEGIYHPASPDQIVSLSLSADGKTLASGGTSRELRLWDVAKTLAPQPFAGHEGSVSAAAVSLDGHVLATGDSQGFVQVWDLPTRHRKAVIHAHEGAIEAVVLSPDGSHLLTLSPEREAKLWDVAGERLLRTQPRAATGLMPFSPDGKTFALASRGADLLLFSIDSSKTTTLPGGKDAVAIVSSAFSPDGKIAVGGFADGSLRFWDVNSQKLLETRKEHRREVSVLAFSPDGKTLASAGPDRMVMLWDVATRSPRASMRGARSAVTSLAFSADGQTLASVSAGNQTLDLWDVDEARHQSTLSVNGVKCVAFLPDGSLLTGSPKGVSLWDTPSTNPAFTVVEPIKTQPRMTLTGHRAPLRSLDVSLDGKRMTSRDVEGIIKIWNTETGEEIASLGTPETPFRSMAISPDGQFVAVGVRNVPPPARPTSAFPEAPDVDEPPDRPDLAPAPTEPPGVTPIPSPLPQKAPEPQPEAKIWDIAASSFKATLSGTGGDVVSLEYAPDGKTLATATRAGALKLWDAIHFTELSAPSGHNEKADLVGFTVDGSTLVAGTAASGHVTLWTPGETAPRATLHHPNAMTALRASPDGKSLATGGGLDESSVESSSQNRGQICLWDATTGNRTRLISVPEGRVTRLVISPDGARIAAATDSKAIILWDTATGERLASLDNARGPSLSLAFSPDGNRLAAGDDSDVRIWDAVSGKLLASWKAHDDVISWIVFAKDGTTLTTASQDTTLKIWDTPEPH